MIVQYENRKSNKNCVPSKVLERAGSIAKYARSEGNSAMLPANWLLGEIYLHRIIHW